MYNTKMQKVDAGSFPDPVVTANVYCSGQLDGVIASALAPFWRAVREQGQAPDSYLWFLRYSKCGEHVKVRVHGPTDQRQLFERLLTDSVTAYLSFLGAPGPASLRKSRQDVPPIDVQDDAEVDYPDRAYLRTDYRRSPVSLGGKPFLDDDVYAGLLTRCLGQTCETAFEVLALYARGEAPHRARQTALLKLLILGLAALGLPERDTLAYLAYHRDWLLRYLQAKGSSGLDRTAGSSEILERFDRTLETMGSALETLGRTAEQLRSSSPADGQGSARDSVWPQALGELHQYVARFREDSGYRLDPFAADPVFCLLFKVFHGAANQLGLEIHQEAFSCHLLAASIVGEPKPTGG